MSIEKIEVIGEGLWQKTENIPRENLQITPAARAFPTKGHEVLEVCTGEVDRVKIKFF